MLQVAEIGDVVMGQVNINIIFKKFFGEIILKYVLIQIFPEKNVESPRQKVNYLVFNIPLAIKQPLRTKSL